MKNTETYLPPLNIGEAPVDSAPSVRLRNGSSCIPQHYLRYAHTRQSVETLVMDMDYDPDYLIFVSENAGGIYIQIGVAGLDNYKPADRQPGRKIVFGRLWRVEPTLPTSEIIQTVFLALKTAREHEVRELFTITSAGHKTTPLSNHHDLPLMARHSEDLTGVNHAMSRDEIIDTIAFAGGKFKIIAAEQRLSGQWLLDLKFMPATENPRPDMDAPMTLMLADLSPNAIYHGIMDEVLRRSNLHVARNFTFRGFARFSPDVDILAIAELSSAVRARPKNVKFATNLAGNNYDTDAGRVPVLSDSAYADKMKSDISKLDIRAGFVPA